MFSYQLSAMSMLTLDMWANGARQ